MHRERAVGTHPHMERILLFVSRFGGLGWTFGWRTWGNEEVTKTVYFLYIVFRGVFITTERRRGRGWIPKFKVRNEIQKANIANRSEIGAMQIDYVLPNSCAKSKTYLLGTHDKARCWNNGKYITYLSFQVLSLQHQTRIRTSTCKSQLKYCIRSHLLVN